MIPHLLIQCCHALLLPTDRYAGGADAALLGRYGLASSLLGVQPWCTPSWEDFQTLAAVGDKWLY